jgi:hypothetical protein
MFMTAQENVKQKMRFIEVLLIMVAVVLLIIPPAWADSPPPVTTMKVYFERDNIPVNEAVKFTVNCSAYDNPEINQRNVVNEFGDIFSYSAICPSYGCFMTSYQYEDYEHLTSCDFFGELNREQFTILNYTKNPFSCTMIDRRTQSCELHINISSANFAANKTQGTNITPTPINRVVIMETPPMKTVETKGIFDEFICLVKNLLGGTC